MTNTYESQSGAPVPGERSPSRNCSSPNKRRSGHRSHAVIYSPPRPSLATIATPAVALADLVRMAIIVFNESVLIPVLSTLAVLSVLGFATLLLCMCKKVGMRPCSLSGFSGIAFIWACLFSKKWGNHYYCYYYFFTSFSSFVF